MIFTANKALKAWGRVLPDEDLGQSSIASLSAAASYGSMARRSARCI
jgi:hypothetical protein